MRACVHPAPGLVCVRAPSPMMRVCIRAPSSLTCACVRPAQPLYLCACAEPLDQCARAPSRVRAYVRAPNYLACVRAQIVRVVLEPGWSACVRPSSGCFQSPTSALFAFTAPAVSKVQPQLFLHSQLRLFPKSNLCSFCIHCLAPSPPSARSGRLAPSPTSALFTFTGCSSCRPYFAHNWLFRH